MQPTFVRSKCIHVSEQQIALTERGLETPLRRFVCVEAIIYYCSGRVPSCDERGLLHSTSTYLSRTDVAKLRSWSFANFSFLGGVVVAQAILVSYPRQCGRIQYSKSGCEAACPFQARPEGASGWIHVCSCQLLLLWHRRSSIHW